MKRELIYVFERGAGLFHGYYSDLPNYVGSGKTLSELELDIQDSIRIVEEYKLKQWGGEDALKMATRVSSEKVYVPPTLRKFVDTVKTPQGTRLKSSRTNEDKQAPNYFAEEVELTRKVFDLDQILSFQMEHDVQIIRGEDWQYMCYIDKNAYGSSLTPMAALVFGIKQYKDVEDSKELV